MTAPAFVIPPESHYHYSHFVLRAVTDKEDQ